MQIRIVDYRTDPLTATISVRSRADFLDTAENRFVKMVLAEFRDFVADVASHLSRDPTAGDKPEIRRLLAETRRLRGMLESQMGRAFLPDVSAPEVLPLGSSVLQRKGGYRELFRYWLQFHAGAQLPWEGGADVFEAGARNVATLYEYWLFFQLETLFRQKFACDQPLHALIVDKSRTPPQLALRRGVELRTPVAGCWSQKADRNLRAEFHFNRKFRPPGQTEARQAVDEEHIYALLRTQRDPAYGAQMWDQNKVMEPIETFETDARNRLVENVGRTSPYPRILPLLDLLKARL